MMIALLTAVVLSAGPNTDAFEGKVRVVGSSINRTVKVVGDAGEVKVAGDLASEIGRLASAKVELLGKREGDTFTLEGYRIIDVGGGAKPLVGTLTAAGDGLALTDGSGDPIPLNMPARSKRRLTKKVGAKVWVFGKKLVSGELRVQRYGVLREAAPAPKPANKETQQESP